MIGVFVSFRYGDNFDERAVRKIAETARERFAGMLRERVTGLYEVRPSIEFVQIAALVENIRP